MKQAELEVKKSKFLSFIYNIDDESQAIKIVDNIKKEHKKARHIPYAYKLDVIAKKSDDKEPSNTAGAPILNIIELKKMNNCLIAVVRYFGGIKLGAGGLLRAYSQAANEATKI